MFPEDHALYTPCHHTRKRDRGWYVCSRTRINGARSCPNRTLCRPDTSDATVIYMQEKSTNYKQKTQKLDLIPRHALVVGAGGRQRVAEMTA